MNNVISIKSRLLEFLQSCEQDVNISFLIDMLKHNIFTPNDIAIALNVELKSILR